MAKMNYDECVFIYVDAVGNVSRQRYLGVENGQALLDDLNWRRMNDADCDIMVSYDGDFQLLTPKCRKLAPKVMAAVKAYAESERDEIELARMLAEKTMAPSTGDGEEVEKNESAPTA